MRRREFIALFGFGLAAKGPMAACAQQRGIAKRVGILIQGESNSLWKTRVETFRSTLTSLGWIEGHNVDFDLHFGALAPRDFQLAAGEMLRFRPDAILVDGTAATIGLNTLTSEIPIVFVDASDPLGSGLVASIARPGTNIAGFTNREFSIAGYALELLIKIIPRVKQILVIGARDNSGSEGQMTAAKSAGARLGVSIVSARVSDRDDLKSSLDTFANEKNGGFVVLSTPINASNRDLIIEHARKHKVPAIYPYREYILDDGLVSHGSNEYENYKKAATYVDRILRGERPADLPVQYPSKYEMVVNKRTATAFGLTLSESFSRASRRGDRMRRRDVISGLGLTYKRKQNSDDASDPQNIRSNTQLVQLPFAG